MLWYLPFKFVIIPLILATLSDAIFLHSQFLKESSIFPVFTSYFSFSLYPVQQVFFLLTLFLLRNSVSLCYQIQSVFSKPHLLNLTTLFDHSFLK